jgi:protein-S-isoprenylcysteine O-methyltransferase Ste14
LLGAGAVFGIAGAIVLGRNRTVFPEPLPQARLVRSGIYSIVRHQPPFLPDPLNDVLRDTPQKANS